MPPPTEKVPTSDQPVTAFPNEQALKSVLGNNTFGTCLNLTDLGNPAVLGFYAEVRQGMVLDRTAWHFVIIQDR